MGKSSGGGDSTSVSYAVSDPWQGAQGSMTRALQAARHRFENGDLRVQPYQGQRVAPFSGNTQTARHNLFNLPDTMSQAAVSNLDSMIDGGEVYRDFDRIRSTVADDVKANLASTFAGGAINSGLAGDTYTRALGDALAGVEYGAWDNAQNRRLSALSMAPQFAREQFNQNVDQAQARLGVGQMQDARAQAIIDANMDLHNERETAGINELREFANLSAMMGGMGGSSSTSQTMPDQRPNPFSAAAGGLGTYGALLGAGVSSPLAIGGGILAGLGSLF